MRPSCLGKTRATRSGSLQKTKKRLAGILPGKETAEPAGEGRAARRAGVALDGSNMLGSESGRMVGKMNGRSGNSMAVTSGIKVVGAHGVGTHGKMTAGKVLHRGTYHNHSVAQCMAKHAPGTSW